MQHIRSMPAVAGALTAALLAGAAAPAQAVVQTRDLGHVSLSFDADVVPDGIPGEFEGSVFHDGPPSSFGDNLKGFDLVDGDGWLKVGFGAPPNFAAFGPYLAVVAHPNMRDVIPLDFQGGLYMPFTALADPGYAITGYRVTLELAPFADALPDYAITPKIVLDLARSGGTTRIYDHATGYTNQQVDIAPTTGADAFVLSSAFSVGYTYVGPPYDPGNPRPIVLGESGIDIRSVRLEVFTSPIPEPGTWAMLAGGAALVAARRRVVGAMRA